MKRRREGVRVACLWFAMITCLCGLCAGEHLECGTFEADTAFDVPGEAPAAVRRVVSWNVEFLGTRNPPRTPEQLAALGERMAGFDASLIVLQEIYDLVVLEAICSYMPGSWEYFNAGKEHVFLYDVEEIELLSGETLTHLSSEPYTE